MSGTTCTTCGLATRITQFLVAPFTSNVSLRDWLYLAGLILIAAYLWSRVNRTITDLL
jgi:hypothetical protein